MHSRSKPTLLIGHPLLARGGSESKVLWAIQTLRDQFNIALITCGPVELDALNQLCGTDVRPGDFHLHRVKLPRTLLRTAAALRGAFYLREFRRLAQSFDLLISAYNPCDLGKPAIQFIADFSWHDETRNHFHPGKITSPALRQTELFARRFYRRTCDRVAQNRIHQVLQRDLLIANSHWTAAKLQALGGRNISIIYPPVTAGLAASPWEARSHSFVAISRIAPEKRLEDIIQILQLVRRERHSLKLHLIGPIGADRYSRRIKDAATRNRDWIVLKGPLYGRAKTEALAKHRFGIHACQGEAFGISVAEMVNAGCITFGPKTGGAFEILKEDSLTFNTVAEAATKIQCVLENVELQKHLRQTLAHNIGAFGPVAFQKGLAAALEQYSAKPTAVRATLS